MDVLVLIRRCEDGRGTPRLSLSFLEMDEESWNTLVVVSVIGRNTYSSIEVTLQEPILSILVYRMRLSSIITPNQSSPSPVTTTYLKPIHPCLLKYANHIPSKSTVSHTTRKEFISTTYQLTHLTHSLPIPSISFTNQYK